MSTPAAFPFAGGFLLPAHNGSALVTVFASVRARHKHRPTLGAGPRPSSVEQGGPQPLVCWQDGGAEPLTNKGIADTLDTDTRLPAVIKSKAVAAVIVAALMHQPPDGPVLLVGQPGNVLHRSTSRRFCRVCSCWRIATLAFRFTCCSLRKSFWMGLYCSYSAVYSCLSLACSCSHA